MFSDSVQSLPVQQKSEVNRSFWCLKMVPEKGINAVLHRQPIPVTPWVMLLNCFIGFHPSYPASDNIKWKGAATQARGQSIAGDKVICFFLFYLPWITMNYGASTTIACVKNCSFFSVSLSLSSLWHRCRGMEKVGVHLCFFVSVKADTVQVKCLRSLSPLVVWPGREPGPSAFTPDAVSLPLNLYSACRSTPKMAQSDRSLASPLFILFENSIFRPWDLRDPTVCELTVNAAGNRCARVCIGKAK